MRQLLLLRSCAVATAASAQCSRASGPRPRSARACTAGHRRPARRFPRQDRQRQGLFRRRQLGPDGASESHVGGPGAMAAPASRARGPDRGPCRLRRHARSRARGRRPARGGSAQLSGFAGRAGGAADDVSWGKERVAVGSSASQGARQCAPAQGDRAGGRGSVNPRMPPPLEISVRRRGADRRSRRAMRAPGAGPRRSRGRSFRARSRRGIAGRGCSPTAPRG